MSVIRRWGLPAFLLCLPALGLPCAARAADESPGAKTSEAGIREALKNVINEGADMYNGQGQYTERDYLGCYHLYQGALLAVRPLLAAHADLQKAIDEGLESARATADPTKRAFVLRTVIDEVREGVKSGKTSGPKTLWERLGGEAGVSKVVDDFVAAAATDPKVDFFRGGKVKLDAAGVAHLKKELIDFVSSATGGPFKYIGKSMKEVHKGMGITNAQFDAAAADLTAALEQNGVKHDDIKAVLDAVATTRKDIVEAAPPPPAVTIKGTVKSAEKDRIVIVNADKKDWPADVTADTSVIIDGKVAPAADKIPVGAEITATIKDGKATKIEATSPTSPPPPPAVETKGTVKSAEKDRIVVIDAEKKERILEVNSDTKVTIDGKDGKAQDIKPGDSVTASSKEGKATKLEVKRPATPPGAETLWDRLGGEANVAKVVDDFVNTAAKDPKVNFFRDPTFQPSKEQVAHLKKELIDFVSSAAGGPFKYTGKSMKEAHKGMKITNAEFDAAVADLKAALEKNGAKPDDAKAVLDAVEGTRKDIVEVKGSGDEPKPKEDKPKPPEDKQADTGNVSGKVSFQGAPVTDGVLTLIGSDGKTYTAKVADGTYSIKDVKPGKYKVTVNTDDPKNPNKVVKIPVTYQDADKTPLSVTVKKGNQDEDFELKD